MPTMVIYVSDETLARLKRAAKEDEMGRSPDQLAEDAVEETALRWSNYNERNRT